MQWIAGIEAGKAKGFSGLKKGTLLPRKGTVVPLLFNHVIYCRGFFWNRDKAGIVQQFQENNVDNTLRFLVVAKQCLD